MPEWGHTARSTWRATCGSGAVNAWNDGDHHAWILGGAWSDPDYMFTVPYHLPPTDRSSQNGFRLVRYVDPVADELQASVALLRRDYDDIQPVSDEVFEAYRRIYAYTRTDLNPSVESRDESAPDWIREEIHLDTSDGEGRIPLLLFLPKEGKPPYQVVVRFPGLGAFANQRSHERVSAGNDRIFRPERTSGGAPHLRGLVRAIHRCARPIW